MIGYMPMPADFKYKDIFLKGYPQHDRFDRFRIKHPSMDRIRRAKLFSPFDALAGFSTAIGNKEQLYVERRVLPPAELEGLNETLEELHELTINGKVARRNKVSAEISYYVPCDDSWSEWYQVRGKYKTVKGIVMNVDNIFETITIIKFEDNKSKASTKPAVETKISFIDIEWIKILE